ncbi:hypothetical protein GCM10010191_47190 [Actinomadura vinacea]|uniref:O-methyltransferase dimerisation domain-containing protein n=1 Tax=Actinomadura vinacea TaxID=115336 RepID=A0ABP5WJE4_9ACTN
MTGGMQATRDVVDLIPGRWRAQALYTAVELGLPDFIEAGRTTCGELAESTGAEEAGIHRLTRGVFEGSERTGYRNTEASTAPSGFEVAHSQSFYAYLSPHEDTAKRPPTDGRGEG